MSYVNDGNERSLFISVSKTVNGIVTSSTDYDGRNMFIQNDVMYPLIDDSILAEMSEVDYETRLNALCDFVESLNPGFTAIRTIDGASTDNCPRRTNLTSCPIPS